MCTKPCTGCKKTLPRTAFSPRFKGSPHVKTKCKKCSHVLHAAWRIRNKDHVREQARKWSKENPVARKRHFLKKDYGMSLEEYAILLESQNGTCANCHKSNTDGISLHVDHCHRTGKVRALLCRLCNIGIGYFLDDPHLLRSAAAYLERHSHVGD